MIFEQVNRTEESVEQAEQWFEQYRGPLYGYLLRLVGERDSALDLTQELFVRVLRQSDLARIENPRAWLYRLATNLAFDLLRRRRRLQWLPWQRAEQLTAPEQHPDFSDEVTRTLLSLPPDARAVLLLYGAYGFSVREVAAALGCREGAMRTRLFRAREQFRIAYAKEIGDG